MIQFDPYSPGLTAAVSMAFTLVTRGFATILSFSVVKNSSEVQNCRQRNATGGTVERTNEKTNDQDRPFTEQRTTG